MSFLYELFHIASDNNADDEPTSRSTISVSGTMSFEHDVQTDQVFNQMMEMPQFKKLLEQHFTHAFKQTITQFLQQHGRNFITSGQGWTDNFEGDIQVGNVKTNNQR